MEPQYDFFSLLLLSDYPDLLVCTQPLQSTLPGQSFLVPNSQSNSDEDCLLILSKGS